MSDNRALCKLCGEPMPKGEEVFYYHGHSGPCPKPPLVKMETLDHLENFRRRLNLSIRGAAKQIGISPTTLSKIERGHIPDRETIYKLASWANSDITVVYKNHTLVTES